MMGSEAGVRDGERIMEKKYKSVCTTVGPGLGYSASCLGEKAPSCPFI